MSDLILRPSRLDDVTQMKKIWKLSFHDEDSFISLFFDFFHKEGAAAVMEVDGIVVSSMFVISGITLSFPDYAPASCSYLYGLATLPEFRGHGYGAKVTAEAARIAYDSGSDFAFLLPASESLYRWYSEQLGTRTAFRVSEMHLTKPVGADGTIKTISPSDYNRLREELLSGHPHAVFSDKLIEWQATVSKLYDGGLFEITTQYGRGCAAAEKTDAKNLFIKELISPNGITEITASILMKKLGCSTCVFRTPVFMGDGKNRDFSVLFPTPDGSKMPLTPDAYWGFAFD